MSNNYNRLKYVFLTCLMGVACISASSAMADNKVDLLDTVKRGAAADAKAERARLNEFWRDKGAQQDLLDAEKSKRVAIEAKTRRQEREFAANDEKLRKERIRLAERIGTLKELFGVIQQATSEANSYIDGSLTGNEIKAVLGEDNRAKFISELQRKAGSSSTIPSVQSLEQFWYELTKEILMSSEVSLYNGKVVNSEGKLVSMPIVRLGSYAAVSPVAESVFLVKDTESSELNTLGYKPKSALTAFADDIVKPQMVMATIDPTKGQLLKIQGERASLLEQLKSGGVIGVVILALGVLALVVSLIKGVLLHKENLGVKAQLSSKELKSDNSLGRILTSVTKINSKDPEVVELLVAEAVTGEVHRITKGVSWIKVISIIAPLIGLLGTVTGMINVFETMSLFGTGDAKLMAGGISQALVTTVLGLVVAIPCALMHAHLKGVASNILVVIEERVTGILAERFEKESNANLAA